MQYPRLPQIEGLSDEQVQTLMNCKKLPQYRQMIRDYRANKCPFCDPLDPVVNHVIRQNASWRMWINKFPAANTRIHLILAHREHRTHEQWITPKDFHDISELYEWATEEFNIEGGAIVMRFGPPKFNAGSVLHLHANIIVPDCTGSVQVTLAKEPEKVRDTIDRMFAFEKVLKGATVDQLSVRERELVKDRLE